MPYLYNFWLGKPTDQDVALVATNGAFGHVRNRQLWLPLLSLFADKFKPWIDPEQISDEKR